MLRKLAKQLLLKYNLRLEKISPRPKWPGETDRLYQSEFVHFDIHPIDKVLDIGSGGRPFPEATILVDRFIGQTEHRHEPFISNNKPLVIADISSLPFEDKYFDFVYCAHLMEHVDDPIAACKEIMRVGRRGYIETPTITKDMLFTWAKGMHKWYVVRIGQNLCFFQYAQRQLEGIRSTVWKDIILSKWYHPLQSAFYNNLDIFNVMFEWSDSFAVLVFYLDGKIESLKAEIAR